MSGSYVRGDWLDGRSDLDIGLVTASGWESGFADVKRIASEAIAGAAFDAHAAGGVDWNLIGRAVLPRTTRQAVDSPYPYFNVFRFDLDVHCQVLWGDDFREWLPPVPPPGELARRFIRLRLQRVSQIEDAAGGRQRALYAAYKAAVVLQLAHGEQILERSFTCHHAAEQIPNVGLRNITRIDPCLSAGRDDAIGDQVEQRESILLYQSIEALVDGRRSGRAEPAHLHLLVETLSDPGDPIPGQPASQVVRGTSDRTEAVVLHDFECKPKGAPKELLPTVTFQMFDQGHVPLLLMPCGCPS